MFVSGFAKKLKKEARRFDRSLKSVIRTPRKKRQQTFTHSFVYKCFFIGRV
jgi:hypothetical protein